jgi:hypothetical protein
LLSIHPPSRIESYNSSASRPRIAIASRGVICPRPCRWDAGTLDERAGDWAHHLQRDGGRNRRRRCVHERPRLRRLAGARPQADLDRRPHHTWQDIETRNRYLRVLFVQAAWVVLITPKSWQPPRPQAVARSGQEAAASQRPRHRARQQARSLPPRHYARKMRSGASTSLAPGGLSPEYSMDWPKLRSSTAHCRNCIATSRAEALRARRRQPQTKGQKSVASCKGSHCTQQCCNLPTALHSLRRVAAVL